MELLGIELRELSRPGLLYTYWAGFLCVCIYAQIKSH